MKVVWTATAKQSVREIYDYIKLDSPTAAKKVRDELIAAVHQIALYPEKYQVDEYYQPDASTIRRCFKWSYRIVYEIRAHQLVVLTILHTSREPNANKTGSSSMPLPVDCS